MEGDREITSLAPEVVRETDEEFTDEFITELLGHRDVNSGTLLALKAGASATCKERIEKLEAVNEDIGEFLELVNERFPGNGEPDILGVAVEQPKDRARVREALALMLKVHINQPNRVENDEPFISHPLRVATEVLKTYKGNAVSQVVAAALLHDSIEDQSRLLALEKGLLPEWSARRMRTAKQVEMDEALHGIGLLFGLHVQYLINSLTSPRTLKEKVATGIKNSLYENYIRKIFSEDSLSPASSVIKWADLKENALTIGGIYKRAQGELEAGNQEEHDRLLATYKKLEAKYRPALKLVRNFFETVPEDHPLYEQREEAIVQINEALATQYRLA